MVLSGQLEHSAWLGHEVVQQVPVEAHGGASHGHLAEPQGVLPRPLHELDVQPDAAVLAAGPGTVRRLWHHGALGSAVAPEAASA